MISACALLLRTSKRGAIRTLFVGSVARFGNTSPTLLVSSNIRKYWSTPTLFAGEKNDDFKFEVPRTVRQKVISASDAVSLIRDGDTLAVSGFVCQGAPEAVLKALGERYEATRSPNNLTILFGGGPGDYKTKGLNHLAKTAPEAPPMLRRTIGGHYGQVPMVAELAVTEQLEAWTLPMGSISRMIRAQSTHSPGHITDVGMGTYVDPLLAGGAANESAKASPLHKDLVRRINIDGQDQLMYKSLPINVAIIRGTTADPQGNISLEHESLLCDQMITAAAARNSGGVVIAQVKRIVASGSIPARSVAIPGPLVDCVVVVPDAEHDELHPMSYMEKYNPVLTGEIRAPTDSLAVMDHDIRKLIARRSFFELDHNTVVNLGIGLPEGVASVAAEEGLLEYITLTTEPGVYGGLPASGHSFGPASNFSAIVEMNQMFDFYNGGGLNSTFLGAAQIGKNGDVNVSRMSKNRLTGPGGFIDISQSTKNICFMTTFTAKGLEVDMPGDGSLRIKEEGQVKKFVSDVFEKTFSGDEAVKRGQKVLYVTERAVFRRHAHSDTLELVEIAEGVDLQKDILDQMDFVPAISPKLKKMDMRIFLKEKMKAGAEMFGTFEEKCTYHLQDHTLFLDLFGISLYTEDDVNAFFAGLKRYLRPKIDQKGPIKMVVNYDGFDLRQGLEDLYASNTKDLEDEYYESVVRFSGKAFKRAKLGTKVHVEMGEWNKVFDEFDTNKNGLVSIEELREGLMNKYHLHVNNEQLRSLGKTELDRAHFEQAITKLLKEKE